MGPVLYFFWLAPQAVGVGLVLLPIHALVGFAGLVGAWVAAVRNPAPLNGTWRWVLLPFAVPVIILVYRVVFNSGTLSPVERDELSARAYVFSVPLAPPGPGIRIYTNRGSA
jgi:hypothetical protein